MGPERTFPMQDGPAIPWSLAEAIYVIYSDVYGRGQSLERLAERGGFSWTEIPFFAKDYRRLRGRAPDWPPPAANPHEKMIEVLVAADNRAFLAVTEKLAEHPDGYDGPCLCGLCRSYA